MRTYKLIGMERRWMFAGLEFKLSDMWIGLYIRNCSYQFEFWLCLIPMLPIHVCFLHGWRKLRKYNESTPLP